MSQESQHIPVLLNEIIDILSPDSEGIYVDGTIGLGGHASAILDASIPNGRVIGIDLDPHALELTSNRLGNRDNRLTLVHDNFRDLDQILTQNSVSAVDGILLDLGVSSMQLNTPDRGFSFLHSGQLDMRMNPNQRISALKIVNETKTDQLANIIYEFGEERWSRRIARAIDKARRTSKIMTTQQLAETISSAIPLATLQITLAVAGATTTASIFIDSWICSSPAFGVFGKSSVMTSFPVKAAKVALPINF